MTRQTSIEVYNQIRQEGLLGAMQFKVYELLFIAGPMTQGEASKQLKLDRNIISPRFAELAAMGVIREAGRRPCKVTERVCLVWEVTKFLPEKPEKRETKDEIIDNLRAENALLKMRLLEAHVAFKMEEKKGQQDFGF